MKAERTDPYKNLLVAAINKLIEEKYISLDLEGVNELEENGHVFVEIFEQKSVILWSNRGFGELYISVWWKYNHSKHPQANLGGKSKENFRLSHPLAKRFHYREFVGVVASCWLERKNSKHIQGERGEYITVYYSRRGEKEILLEVPKQEPNGFETSGPFYF